MYTWNHQLPPLTGHRRGDVLDPPRAAGGQHEQGPGPRGARRCGRLALGMGEPVEGGRRDRDRGAQLQVQRGTQVHAGPHGRDVAQHPRQEPDLAPGLRVGAEGHLATGAPGVVVIDLRAKKLSGLPLKLGNVSYHPNTLPERRVGRQSRERDHIPDFNHPVEGL